MSLILRLPEHNNYSVTVDSKRTLQLFGDTIIGSALQSDPTVDTLDFTQPVMTPEVLNDIVLALALSPTSSSSELKALGSAWNYLGGKLIPVLVSPLYTPGILDIVNTDDITGQYQTLVGCAVKNNFLEWLEYVGSRVAPDRTTQRIDTRYLCQLGRFRKQYGKLIRYFVSRGAIPDTETITDAIKEGTEHIKYFLTSAMADWASMASNIINDMFFSSYRWNDRKETVATFTLLYQHPEWNRVLDPNDLLTKFQWHHQEILGILDVLVMDPRANINAFFQQIVPDLDKYFNQNRSLRIVLRLLDHPDMDPNFDDYCLLKLAFQKNYHDLRRKILTHPKSGIRSVSLYTHPLEQASAQSSANKVGDGLFSGLFE